jgi:hypothetical protein
VVSAEEATNAGELLDRGVIINAEIAKLGEFGWTKRGGGYIVKHDENRSPLLGTTSLMYSLPISQDNEQRMTCAGTTAHSLSTMLSR